MEHDSNSKIFSDRVETEGDLVVLDILTLQPCLLLSDLQVRTSSLSQLCSQHGALYVPRKVSVSVRELRVNLFHRCCGLRVRFCFVSRALGSKRKAISKGIAGPGPTLIWAFSPSPNFRVLGSSFHLSE
jgi:hypothetical protein